jgi:hypothetical protein
MIVTETDEYKPYSVLYLDHSQNKREFCCYAKDAYNAKLEAEELIGSDRLKRILNIHLEPEHFDW